ncbi:hypothetical protein R2F61_03875 [Mollicutes bacterium LVI A0078]|nr:hypothetical protein RZE84_03900 [Mollicutes bacterium LVI A0075]WOO91701.1 hypothetical protein R2F61_03875 [Mollicutes bacterium LVI A0078]
MRDIYRKVNERTVNRMARKIMNHPKSTYQKSVRNGVLAQGEDIKYLEDVIKNEIAFINYSTFKEVSQYNPRNFIKSMKTNNWIKSCLKVLPSSMYE